MFLVEQSEKITIETRTQMNAPDILHQIQQRFIPFSINRSIRLIIKSDVELFFK